MLHAGENIEKKSLVPFSLWPRAREDSSVVAMGGGGLPITDFSNSQNTSHREACRSNLPQSNITQNLSDFSKQKVLHKIGIAQKGYFTIARGVLASSNCSAITGTLVDYCGALLGNLEQMPELILLRAALANSIKLQPETTRGWNALTALRRL